MKPEVLSPPPAPQRVLVIDAMRVIGASLLFCYHLGLNAGWSWSQGGRYATDTFIILVGYCSGRFSRARWKDSTPVATGFLRYPINRLRKLFLPFWIVSIVIFLGSQIYPAATMQTAFTWEDLGLNFLGLNQYFGERYLSRTMWFIPFVVQIYFLIPILRPLSIRPVTTLAGCLVVSVTLSFLVFQMVPEKAVEICRTWSPLFRLPTVFLGVALGVTPRREWPGIFLAFGLGTGALALAAPGWPSMETTLIRPWNGLLLGMLVTAGAWLLARSLATLPRLQGVMTRLGQASYPFFLLHGVMISFLWTKFQDSPMVWTIYFTCCWLASLMVVDLTTWLHRIAPDRGRDRYPQAMSPGTAATRCDFPSLSGEIRKTTESRESPRCS